MVKFYHVIIYVPLSHTDDVRQALAEAGAGTIGAYDSCSFSVRGIGRFRPLEGAKPHIGSSGAIEEVEAERIEVLVPHDAITAVLRAVKNVHPYEEPAIHVLPMEDYKSFLGT